MDVIVTGALGFIGSHLCDHFLKQGCRVVGIDDLSTSTLNSRHSMELLKQHNFLFKNFSIEDKDSWSEIAGHHYWGLKPSLIFNFACPASPPLYQRMAIKTMMTCTAGTNNVLEYASQQIQQIKVIHASTSEVYGDPQVSPQSEEYRGCVNPFGPRSCYDEGKRAAEALCHDYMTYRGVDVRIVRIFNTYGPHLSPYDGRVVSNFIKQALANEPMTIYGDGSQTRSMCYVSDLVDGIVKLSELKDNPKFPINLGNPQEFKMKALAEIVREIVSSVNDKPSTSDLIYEPLPVDDPKQRLPDIKKASLLLKWYPKVGLHEGISMTARYMKDGY